MTASLVPTRRFAASLIVMPDDSQSPQRDEAFRDIADANDHLHRVLEALLKERSGQPLTSAERQAIDLHIAAQKWQLEHTNMESQSS